ncbi:MAG: DUF177 domain-containing protein [Gammaproteobacteria bacterium]|nr:DUF177 domain-containing protein [Gammaproteobacteria bacterium]
MSGGLPEFLDLTKAGHMPLTVAGQMSLSRMPRLCAAIADVGGQASIDLQVFKEGGLAVVSGRLQASLGLSCQRCFALLRHPVDAQVRLGWAAGGQAQHWPESYELLDPGSGRIRLAELVEDELLLALPLAPRHARPEDCEALRTPVAKPDTIAPPEAGRRPFEILKTLRRR